MLDNYIWSEAGQVPQNNVSNQDEASHLISHAVCSQLDEIFPSSQTGRYGPKTGPAKWPELASQEVFI